MTAEDERGFYDRWYEQFLSLPDHALRCSRETLRADLDNPAKETYERRLLFKAVLAELLREPVHGVRALDYGCGTGGWGLLLATEGADVTFLDLSPVAVEVARRRAVASGVAERARGVARDASDLTCFADSEFQLVYAGAALHHTLKYSGALAELARVIAPGGRLVLAETYGDNPVLHLARRARARLTGEPVEAGEEIVLRRQEIERLRAHFKTVETRPMISWP